MRVRICVKCGTQNPENALECVDCGATLSLETVTQEASIVQGEILNERDKDQIARSLENKYQNRVLPHSNIGKTQAGGLGMIFLVISISGFVNTPENWRLCVILLAFALVMLSYALGIWWLPGTAYAK